MPDRRRGRALRSTNPLPEATVQKTLRDHFQRNAHPKEDPAATPETQPQEPADIIHIDTDTSDAEPSAVDLPSSRTAAKQGHTSDKLYPLFVRPHREKRPTQIIDVDDGETRTSSECGTTEAELPPLSSHQGSPRSDLSRADISSRASSPFSAGPSLRARSPSPLPTSQARSITSKSMGCHDPNKKSAPFNPRIRWDSGTIAPFPDHESQHVRGIQRSFSASESPLGGRSCITSKTPCDDLSLSFLAKKMYDETTPTYDDRVRMWWQHSSRNSQEDLSLQPTEDHATAHPAISRTPPDTQTSNVTGDMWSYRFRPKRAEEVLGNEKRALYLRNWLRTLELRSQTQLTANSGLTDAANKQNGKCEPGGSQPRGQKRPHVVRAVTKPRGRKKRRFGSDDELDDFIACSDGDDASDIAAVVEEESEDEFAFCQRTLSRLHRQDVSRSQPSSGPPFGPVQLPGSSNGPLSDTNEALADPTFSDTLTNTLLIAGPSGCGKTAAVYACAEELGWDVFEVYPGIGRRTAANLDYLVGNVGRNHIIQASQSHSSRRHGEQGSSTTLSALFGKGRQEPVAHRAREGSRDDPIGVGDETFSVIGKTNCTSENSSKILDPCSPKPSVAEVESTVRQSLVLLEEVDILFKDDVGFWPAVVDLIRDCKRPIVMTCNDLRLVPTESLPLQAILVFESCPSAVAVSYLQSVMLAIGCPAPRERLMALYETTPTIDGIEPPLYPRTEPLPSPDLRRTITQLQMLCSSVARGSTSDMLQGAREAAGHVRRSGRPISVESNATRLPSTECERWRRMSKHADLLSFVNSNLCRAPLHTPEALSFSVTEPTLDDELGHSMLFMDGCSSNGRAGLAFYHYDELIALDAILLSRGVHEELDTDPTAASINPAASLTTEEAEIFRSRVAYQSQIAGALQHIIQPPGPLMPQSSVFLDYIPWVRYMVVVDDNLEQMARDEVARAKSARLTRNSMKTRHIRNIDLNERQQEALSRTQLIDE